MKKESKNLLEAINYYAQLNIIAFPVKIKITRRGKRFVKNVKFPFEWKKMIPNLHYSRELIRSGNFNGIAIRTGKISNLFVLDIDITEQKTNGLLLLEEEGVKIPPETPCVITQSGGYHFYFKYVSDLDFKSTGSCKNYNIDWRGENGLVFAPPTQISKTKLYKWKKKLTKENLMPPPKKLINWLKERYDSLDDVALGEYQGKKRIDELSKKQRALFEN